MLSLITCILQINFCAILFNRTQDLHFSKNSGKFVITAPSRKLCPQKLYQYHLLKLAYCMQNFVRFHAIEYDIELSYKNLGKRNSSAPYTAIYTQIGSLLFLMIYNLHIIFGAIPFIRNRDRLIPKIPEKL